MYVVIRFPPPKKCLDISCFSQTRSGRSGLQKTIPTVRQIGIKRRAPLLPESRVSSGRTVMCLLRRLHLWYRFPPPLAAVLRWNVRWSFIYRFNAKGGDLIVLYTCVVYLNVLCVGGIFIPTSRKFIFYGRGKYFGLLRFGHP